MTDEDIDKYVNFDDFKHRYVLECYVDVSTIDTEEKMRASLKDGSVIIIDYCINNTKN